MRIGILTLPLHTNYGGILQAYALQTILERMGHEVVVFDKSHHRSLPLWKRPMCYSKRFLQKYFLNKPVRIFEEQYHNRIYPVISQCTQVFIDKYIHRQSINQFCSLNPADYDAIVVGSDQVWRICYFTSGFSTSIENAFLKFAENWNIRRISYAASFGTDEWEYPFKDTINCGKLLHRFDAVSVREDSGIKLCHEYFNIDNVRHVLDPTMLLDVDDYIRLFQSENTPESQGTLLSYILDETDEKTKLIEKIALQNSLIPFRVNSKVESLDTPLNECIQPPVEQWLRGFYDTKFVVTDSFHACVFSILFRKPFIVYGNKGRGLSRFYSLLSLFGLENRLITSIDSLGVLSEIDYDKVSKKIHDMKIYSISFIESALN